MKKINLAIIGAGITGLYLAWKLSEKGEKVTIFEKKDSIGKISCSGLFSERILDFIPESKNLIKNKIDYCLIKFPKKTIKIKFSKKFFVISHFQLDNLVAKLSQKSGVKIILNENFTKEDSVRLNEFDKVIGCDGANSIIRKFLNLKEPNYYLGIQGFIKKEDSSNFVETWPTKNGFLWKIPKGEEIEYGIIEKPEKAKIIFEEFLKKNNLFLEKINSALIPQNLIILKNKKFILCGDAAGLVKPWSGGGVIWSLTAANLILKNFPDFLKGQKEIKKFFLLRFIMSKIIKKVVYFLGFNFPWILPKEYKIESDFLT